MTPPAQSSCRSCRADAVVGVLDLGDMPVADDLCDDAPSARRAPRHRLAIGLCTECGLVQLDPATPVLASAAHGHGGGFSGTVLAHESQWAEELMALASLPERATVLDTGSGAGGLLRPFRDAGHEVRGWERDEAHAASAREAGIPTAHLDGNHEGEPGRFDLVIVNHTLSHADDLDTAVGILAASLAPGGTLAVEFHSALGILTGGQFDVVCHAHRSYLSLGALAQGLRRHDLVVTRATSLPLHGGVVRLLARPVGSEHVVDDGVAALLEQERAAGLGDPGAWTAVAQQAATTRERLRDAVLAHRSAGRTVAGYGAPSRGTTLLNYCGLGADEVPRTADRSAAKQGRCLPGAATTICSPDDLAADPPDVLVVLVWPLRDEVLAQLDHLRAAGTRFLLPLPELEEVG